MTRLERYRVYLGYLALPRFDSEAEAMEALPVTGTEVRRFTITHPMSVHEYCSTYLREMRGQPEPVQVVSSHVTFQYGAVSTMRDFAITELGTAALDALLAEED
jgi:hypothetical protein